MNEIIILALTTSLGNFEIELYPDQAPVTSANFLEYAEEGFFENVLFHRVIPGFVIQGGGSVSYTHLTLPTIMPV